MAAFNLVLRGGTIVDGSNGQPYEADIGIVGDHIAKIGKIVARGEDEIDAKGMLVTPGFVDIHTHYDGQATWSTRLAPSSTHGVTTVVMGNCGVGFAPCRPEERKTLVKVMEGVEDIPEVVMDRGIPWAWQSFPEYLDFLDGREYDVDLGTQVPHGPVRVYVMGERGVNRECATDDDIAQMAALVREGVEAGALGFSTSRTLVHRLKDGSFTPTMTADERELVGIALGLKAAGRGVLQMVEDTRGNDIPIEIEYGMWRRIIEASGRPMSCTVSQSMRNPEKHREVLTFMEEANKQGIMMKGQAGNRPVGVIFGLDCSMHPFMRCPSYVALADRPLAEKVRAMSDPEIRVRLIREAAAESQKLDLIPAETVAKSYEFLYRLGDPPDYFPAKEHSIAALAARRGISAIELAYDFLMEYKGAGELYAPLTNFYGNSDDAMFEIMRHEHVMPGLSDGGAHLGMLCDASAATHLLTYWTRDRRGEKLSVSTAIHMLAKQTADYIGLRDRGLLVEGFRADINIIDYDRLHLHAPHAVHDLPAGGMRLDQKADGYRATILKGKVTYENGRSTGRLPGRLIRGERSPPRAAVT